MRSCKWLAGSMVIAVAIGIVITSASTVYGGPGGGGGPKPPPAPRPSSGPRPSSKPNPAARGPSPAHPPKLGVLKADNRMRYLPTSRDPIAKNGKLVIHVRVPPGKDGRGGYEGRVDLMKTIQRIHSGGPKLSKGDGEPYANKTEPRIGGKPGNYWKKYVVETPGVAGAGKQRLLVGEKGELIYTNNHYKSWRWISRGKGRDN